MLPCGTFPRTWAEDKAIIRTRLQWGLFIGFLVVIFILPLLLPMGFIGMINIAVIILVAVVGLQITTGYAGQVNMGQASFVGMGAFTTAALASHFGLPFWMAILGGGIGASIYGSIFGLPAARLKGFYLALTTLAAQFIFTFFVRRMPGFGGLNGLGVEPAKIGNIMLSTPVSQCYLILVVAIIMVFFAYGIVRSRTGRALTAIRDNENAAEILGIKLSYYKTLAFAIGTFYAGISGGLLAYYLLYVHAEQFVFMDSLWYLGMIIVGGMGSVLGAILGTILLRTLVELIIWLGPTLSEALPAVGADIWFAGMNLILGGLIVLVLMFEPKGLVHRWNIFKHTYRLWPFPY
jgi:branched-chain amino acid transport system permease protein